MLNRETIAQLDRFCKESNEYWDQGGASYKFVEKLDVSEPASNFEVSKFFNRAIGKSDESDINSYQVILSETVSSQDGEALPVYYLTEDNDCFATMTINFKLKSNKNVFVELFWSMD